ncbi:MAG: hypothetical protein AAB919_01695 [Patescibacteria group bacterium]
MLKLQYAPAFFKQFKKLEPSLKEKALKSVELFKDKKHHRRLGVHKLKGVMRGRFSFSVDFHHRIVFIWVSDGEAALLAIGNHDIYQ